MIRNNVAAWIEAALETYPTDRSCATCDYEFESECRRWNETVEIPPDVFRAGCEGWRDEGVPF